MHSKRRTRRKTSGTRQVGVKLFCTNSEGLCSWVTTRTRGKSHWQLSKTDAFKKHLFESAREAEFAPKVGNSTRVTVSHYKHVKCVLSSLQFREREAA